MVFGNCDETSATGVAFTRNPSTGENALYGEFLVNAQGEDVVAGICMPGPLGAVEVNPLADDPFGLEAVGQLMQISVTPAASQTLVCAGTGIIRADP